MKLRKSWGSINPVQKVVPHKKKKKIEAEKKKEALVIIAQQLIRGM